MGAVHARRRNRPRCAAQQACRLFTRTSSLMPSRCLTMPRRELPCAAMSTRWPARTAGTTTSCLRARGALRHRTRQPPRVRLRVHDLRGARARAHQKGKVRATHSARDSPAGSSAGVMSLATRYLRQRMLLVSAGHQRGARASSAPGHSGRRRAVPLVVRRVPGVRRRQRRRPRGKAPAPLVHLRSPPHAARTRSRSHVPSLLHSSSRPRPQQLHLLSAVGLGRLCLVEPLQRAVVPLVEAPGLDVCAPRLGHATRTRTQAQTLRGCRYCAFRRRGRTSKGTAATGVHANLGCASAPARPARGTACARPAAAPTCDK